VAFLRLAIALLAAATMVTAARGQVVQLPTFNYFTIQTSVLAPDSGRGYLGGVRRGSYGRNSRGVPGFSKVPGVGPFFGGRGIGGSGSTSVTSVRATIIDHDEWDKAVLSAAAGRSGGVNRTSSTGATSEPSTTGGSNLQSLAEIRRQNSAKKNARVVEAERLFAEGAEAEKNGKYGVARIYYRRAAKVAEGDLGKQIAARLAAIDALKATSSRTPSRDR
jgi:type II secretory pathway component GspD/PulD (secretin)